MKIAQQAAAMASDDAEARVWLGVAQLLNGERAIAEGELLRAAELDPKSALARLYLGRLYGRDNDGRQAYERAIAALDPAGPIGAQAKRTLALPWLWYNRRVIESRVSMARRSEINKTPSAMPASCLPFWRSWWS
ncbi:MAG: hypothetical protein U0559_02470 [Anaerolineae bacterium]